MGSCRSCGRRIRATTFVEDALARVRDLLVHSLWVETVPKMCSATMRQSDIADLHRQASALGLRSLTSIADTINDAARRTMSGASPRMRRNCWSPACWQGVRLCHSVRQPRLQRI